jgi:hypothetical protein
MIVKIGAKHYKINLVEMKDTIPKEENVDPSSVSGFIDYNNSEIYVEKNLKDECIRENVIHELLHGLLDRKNMEIVYKNSSIKEVVENIVEYLTPRFHAMLEDNPKFQEQFLKIKK